MFCSSLRKRPTWSHIVPVLLNDKTAKWKETHLDSHDIAFPVFRPETPVYTFRVTLLAVGDMDTSGGRQRVAMLSHVSSSKTAAVLFLVGERRGGGTGSGREAMEAFMKLQVEIATRSPMALIPLASMSDLYPTLLALRRRLNQSPSVPATTSPSFDDGVFSSIVGRPLTKSEMASLSRVSISVRDLAQKAISPEGQAMLRKHLDEDLLPILEGPIDPTASSRLRFRRDLDADTVRLPKPTQTAMAHRLGIKGPIDLEALSPRDANAQKMPKATEMKAAAAQFKSAKDKQHPPPPPPQVLEPPSPNFPDGCVYQVGKLLGKGGFAICFNAQLQSTKQRFALKIVKSTMPPKMEQKFQTELQIHSKMRQRNIVQFFRAFTFEQSTFLVLEICPNGSLMDMVKRRKGLTEPEVRFYAVQMAGAIKYMHGKGIIHRDLKMGNIFLDSRMNAKIGDFGLAALVVTGRDMQTIRRTTLCGTPNYIAPEILQKGKKGHDHMVDIWSLGIIMFAMLTSKPPFQSSTTDEIYRRARDRDYEWPDPETTQKFISDEAKDLVASMLESPELRPEPDAIVDHAWFRSGFMPAQSDITPRLRELPPERAEFYLEDLTESMIRESSESLREQCVECKVGSFAPVQVIHSQVWKEMAAEEKAALTPIIPLEEGVVYRPFEEHVREHQLQQKARLATARLAPPREAATEEAAAGPAQPPTGLLRQPPQSFAAQQRAQNRPAAMATATATATVTAPTPASAAAVTSAATLTSKITSAATSTTRAMASAARRSADTATKQPTPPAERKPVTERYQPSEAPREEAPSMRSRPRREAQQQAELPLRSRSETIPRSDAAPALRTRLPTSGLARTLSASSGTERRAAVSERTTSSAPATVRARPKEVRAASLFNPSSEHPGEIPGSKPDVILDRLRRLQTELERALNSRTMAIITSKTATPPHPEAVIKWVDYTNKFGLGYILHNGSIGCVLRDVPMAEGSNVALLPPVCMVVQNAERHVERRQDESYVERHQPVPLKQNVHFFENRGESGLAHLPVPGEQFRVPLGPDGQPVKLEPGRDAYQHRKRERIILWKKFANYMIAYGRDEGGASEEEAAFADRQQAADDVSAPAQVVTFYQRFGDVGCWVFCDGHLQFNFPDHTKVVLDPTGTWCHFWHLPEEAALQLAATGTTPASALDERRVITQPLQTLLNFHRRPTVASSSSSSRRRPEISPELQNIPAANDFRRKVTFIKAVVQEWVSNGGLGNSDMSKEGRLRWEGYRETVGVSIPQKHVWVTVGARWGDERITAWVDPRRPGAIGEDIEERK
ncbi:related to protein kinase CDC5 [Cephalotrichum gorgonifer]|uniref:Related to protein kinase CDC5 n=1 Tax=Cephalotrichum gorgonifer TaxID=2041049 RepID=A0AAE8MNR6_9PEZI|nr:related to protein kinase CDC5 [Cephalotrichum gorgonifer]